MASNRYRDNCPLDCKVYVGELGTSGNRHEIEEAFGYYGPLRNVWVARNPPGFAFVMFEDPRDARDAVRALDGELICGKRIKAELSTGKSRREGAAPRFPPKGPPPRFNNHHRGRSPVNRSGPHRREHHGHSNNYQEQNFDLRENYNNSRYPRKHRSWSRSRSFSPPNHGHVVSRSSGRSGPSENFNGQHNNHHIRSRSRTPPNKSPRSESRYR